MSRDRSTILELPPVRHCRGTLVLPGSKSLSNRALLLAALAQGTTELSNLLDSHDVSRMVEALVSLGVKLQWAPQEKFCRVKGCAGPLPGGTHQLFLGNAGTAMRPLTAALALGRGNYTLTGEPRMYERPIGDLIEALLAMGAHISYLQNPGFPPLQIIAKGLIGGRIPVRGNVSSQFLTGLLMAGPLCNNLLHLEMQGELISKPYVNITLHLMQQFGVTVENRNFAEFLVPKQQYISPGSFAVEGDASSASYFLAAGLLGGGPVRVLGAGKNSVQGDVRFIEVLEKMGALVSLGDDWIEVKASGKPLQGFDLDLNHIPDAAMTAATLGLFAEKGVRISGIASWKVKETDRILAMTTELRKIGARVDYGDDFIRVQPPPTFLPATIETYDDHRMAMCLSLAAFGGKPLKIRDPDCTAKTFPHYFSELRRLCN